MAPSGKSIDDAAVVVAWRHHPQKALRYILLCTQLSQCRLARDYTWKLDEVIGRYPIGVVHEWLNAYTAGSCTLGLAGFCNPAGKVGVKGTLKM